MREKAIVQENNRSSANIIRAQMESCNKCIN